MTKEKSAYNKIRQVWKINPKTRVKEAIKDMHDYCKYCKNMDPRICEDCQLGGA